MDFIVDNYVWFIVIVVIILMAVIGYIADKTDFGRKGKDESNTEKPKKEKKKKETKPKETKIKVEPKGINELSQEITDKNVSTTNDTVTQPVNNSIENQQVNNENIDQSLFAPLTSDQSNNLKEVVKDTDVVESPELKNIEPTKLENPLPETETSQKVAEDEDIWKF